MYGGRDCSYVTLELWKAAILPQNFIFPPFFRHFLDLVFLIVTIITPIALFHMGFSRVKTRILPSDVFRKNRIDEFHNVDSTHQTESFQPNFIKMKTESEENSNHPKFC